MDQGQMTKYKGQIRQSDNPSIPQSSLDGPAMRDWAARVCAGDRRAIARAISTIENREPAAIALLKLLFPKAGGAEVIGVTGSPGTGKSTLVEKLAAAYRRTGSRVGIIAVDPTSPFSGGAILGDRIRMQSLSTDEGVYIRSMATRGHLGGLAATAHEVVSVLEAAGCNPVLIETVGVGQDEVEVARLADATVLVLVPGMGDDIQTFKAGVMEIADVFVINKTDHPGADRVEQELTTMLSITPRHDGWLPLIVKTVATTGEGTDSLQAALRQFHSYGQKEGVIRRRHEAKWRARLLSMLRQRLFEKVVTEGLSDAAVDEYVQQVVENRRDPHSVVEEMIQRAVVSG
jgi:LAO/AO transport system kinase